MRSRVSPGERQCKELDAAWVVAGFTSAQPPSQPRKPCKKCTSVYRGHLGFSLTANPKERQAESGPGLSDSRAPLHQGPQRQRKQRQRRRGAPRGQGQGCGRGLPRLSPRVSLYQAWKKSVKAGLQADLCPRLSGAPGFYGEGVSKVSSESARLRPFHHGVQTTKAASRAAILLGLG